MFEKKLEQQKTLLFSPVPLDRRVFHLRGHEPTVLKLGIFREPLLLENIHHHRNRRHLN